MPRVVIEKGPDAGRAFELAREIVFGRGAMPDVSIPHPTISRRHAQIVRIAAGRFALADLGSQNGTTLNGRPLLKPSFLSDGDRFTLGDVELRFESLNGAAPGHRPERPLVKLVDAEPAAPAPRQVMPVDAFADDARADVAALRRRLRIAQELGGELSQSLAEEQVLARTLARLFEVLPQSERGFVMLRGTDGALEAALAQGRDGRPAEIAVSRTLLADAVEHRRGILTSDAMSDARYATATVLDLRLRSVMCAPLVARDEVLGVIHLDGSDPARPFVGDDMALLLAIAGQAALALSAARAHRQALMAERLQQDLEFATRIQNQFLPQRPPRVEGWEFADKYRPASQIGGDYYDFLDLADGRFGVALGDVCGKGIPAALCMAKLSSEVRFRSVGRRSPAEILTRVNQALVRDFAEGMFVTLVLAVVDPATGEGLIASGGHPAPLVRRADGKVEPLESPRSLPVGFDADTAYSDGAFQLGPGDVVALFTDGITEAMQDTDEYGESRLEAALRSSAATAEGALETVLADVASFVGGSPQSDDLTLVCFGQEPGQVTFARGPR